MCIRDRNNIGRILSDRGDLNGAMEYYQHALKIAEQSGDWKGKITVLSNIGTILQDKGEFNEALKFLQRALESSEKFNFSKGTLITLNNIGKILSEMGEFDEAFVNFQHALEIDPNYFTAWGNIGSILILKGELEKALDHFQHAQEMARKKGKLEAEAVQLNNIGTILSLRGEDNNALQYYQQALNLVQKSFKGKEMDFKLGQIPCPNPNCPEKIQVKMMGVQGAIIETCLQCKTQFSVWIDSKSSKYQIGILSKDVFSGRIFSKGILSGGLEFQEQVGKEVKTTVSEWLYNGAMITKNIASCYEKMGEFLKACETYFQSASMYRGLGFFEKSENILGLLLNLLPKVNEQEQDIFIYEIDQLRKRTSESLRSRDFIYIFVSCPNCSKDLRVQASQTTVATKICTRCTTKFSIYFDNNIQEFYTNILETPTAKTKVRGKGLERDVVKFCVKCGLKIGEIAGFCPRCGLKILR